MRDPPPCLTTRARPNTALYTKIFPAHCAYSNVAPLCLIKASCRFSPIRSHHRNMQHIVHKATYAVSLSVSKGCISIHLSLSLEIFVSMLWRLHAWHITLSFVIYYIPTQNATLLDLGLLRVGSGITILGLEALLVLPSSSFILTFITGTLSFVIRLIYKIIV